MFYIVTDTKTTTETNEETKALVPRYTHEVTAQQHKQAVDLILERKALGDHRVAGCRVFELKVTDAGVPKVGKELSA